MAKEVCVRQVLCLLNILAAIIGILVDVYQITQSEENIIASFVDGVSLNGEEITKLRKEYYSQLLSCNCYIRFANVPGS